METAKLVKFIEGRLKHKSTRVADKPMLQGCLTTLQAGNKLDSTQYTFMHDLITEYNERNKRYAAAAKQRRLERTAIKHTPTQTTEPQTTTVYFENGIQVENN